MAERQDHTITMFSAAVYYAADFIHLEVHSSDLRASFATIHQILSSNMLITVIFQTYLQCGCVSLAYTTVAKFCHALDAFVKALAYAEALHAVIA